MMATGFADDIRQIFVVAKNEMVKYFRGKKAIILAVIVLAVWGINTAVSFIFDLEITNPTTSLKNYFGFAWIIIIVIVTMFSSGAIVSEFEDRTALVLFTRPIRKISIFFGKLLAALIFGIGTILAYALLSMIAVLIIAGGLPDYTGLSVAFMVAVTFAATGVAMALSSIFKRSGTAATMTFFVLMLLSSLISGILVLIEVDSWFIIDVVAGDIINSLDFGFEFTPVVHSNVGGIAVCYPSYDAFRNMGAAYIWGLTGIIASFLLFSRKQV